MRSPDALLEFPGHRSYVRGVVWSPDGTMLVSACGDYTVRVWDSVSRDQRYAQLLAQRALEDEVRAETESIAAAHATPADAVNALQVRWPDDPERVRAGMRVLARRE
ncbi:MAG: WD40 repeat domain-containing protein [Planctomycetota bacterium]